MEGRTVAIRRTIKDLFYFYLKSKRLAMKTLKSIFIFLNLFSITYGSSKAHPSTFAIAHSSIPNNGYNLFAVYFAKARVTVSF